MYGIPHSVGAKVSSQCVGSLGLGLSRISWPENIAETLNSILADELHTCDNVRLHEANKIGEEWLSPVLLVELVSLSRLCEFAHFKF